MMSGSDHDTNNDRRFFVIIAIGWVVGSVMGITVAVLFPQWFHTDPPPVFLACAFSVVLFVSVILPLALSGRANRLRNERLAQEHPLDAPYPFLYAVETRFWTGDRFYKLYLAPDRLCFAWLASQIYDKASAERAFPRGNEYFGPWVQRRLIERSRREALYDSLDPASAKLCEIDSRNFYILRGQIRGLDFVAQASRRNPHSVGILTIELTNHTSRHFAIVSIPAKDILPLLQQFAPDILAPNTG
jgi:hypothetical protein